jgi:hypothetical protein
MVAGAKEREEKAPYAGKDQVDSIASEDLY